MDKQPQDKEPLKELTPELMAGYVKGTLSPKEQEKVEHFLKENDFEAAAVAGLEATATDLAEDLMELESRLLEKTQSTSVPVIHRYWPVAAAISVMLIAGFLFYYLSPLDPVPSQISYNNDSTAVTGNEQPAIVEYKPGVNNQDDEAPALAESEISENITRSRTSDNELTEIAEETIAKDGPAARSLSETSSGGAPDVSSKSAVPSTADQGISATNDIQPSEQLATAKIEDTEAISEVDNIATEDSPVVFRSETKKAKRTTPAASSQRITSPDLPTAKPPSHLEDHITQHLIYPEAAKREAIEGTVKLRFLVDQEGGLSDFQIISGPGHGCEQEAIRVLKTGPAWIPAQINGSSVQSKGEIEIQFPTRN